MKRGRPAFGLCLALPWLVGCAAETTPQARDEAPAAADPARVAEDQRGRGPDGLAPLLLALRDPTPARRALAARALGRLERPDLADTIRTALYDTDPGVRAESANALAQAATTPVAVTQVYGWLSGRLGEENDVGVLGALAHALGRLPYAGTSLAEQAEAQLASMGGRLTSEGSGPALVDLSLGMSAFYRGRREPVAPANALLIQQLATWGSRDGTLESARIRRLATGLLRRLPADAMDATVVVTLGDSDPDVRRLGVQALEAARPETLRERLPLSVADPEPRVRIEALRLWDRTLKSSRGCEPLLFAVRDGDPYVALAALDLLARPCPEVSRQRTILTGVIRELGRSGTWHLPARALVALAGSAPEAVVGEIAPFERHDNPFVRAYAARAAALAGRVEVLERLSNDPEPNVRTVALQGWFQQEGHAVDGALAGALSSDDAQLVLSAASLLEGSPSGGQQVPALLATLERLSAAGMQTLRDPRVALIERIGEFGDSASVAGLLPYLKDGDKAVSSAAASAIRSHSDEDIEISEAGLPPGVVPTDEEIAEMGRTRLLLDMERGGRVGIRLLPDLAPTNVARLVELVRSGRLRGLTFHRVEPNFVVQGGSPGANEYSGHGDFTRDELGTLSHWRGTVGISTRGRDTGDGQIFINLVDNTRLDHNYTIIGDIELGMDVADHILEGDRIIDAVLVEGRPQ